MKFNLWHILEFLNILQQHLKATQVIVIPRYEYDIVVITQVRGEAKYE